jgi:hypothetical protein
VQGQCEQNPGLRIRTNIKAGGRLDCYECNHRILGTLPSIGKSMVHPLTWRDAKSKGSKYLDFGIAHICASSSCLRGVLVYSLEFRVCIDDHLWRCPLSFRIGAIIRTSLYVILLHLEYGYALCML